ncbi:MAG: hypothetical protein M3O36_19575 [Myxococcota bacterium]|nr:hypothetical protein [Myxococcota bacterium]
MFSVCKDLPVGGADDKSDTMAAGPDPSTRGNDTFAVLTIGDGCSIDGKGSFALGGDDVRTGRHALYRFARRAVEPAGPADCDTLGRKRATEFARGRKPGFEVARATR